MSRADFSVFGSSDHRLPPAIDLELSRRPPDRVASCGSGSVALRRHTQGDTAVGRKGGGTSAEAGRGSASIVQPAGFPN